VERVRELLRSDEGGSARALGGLLLATGILVVLFRRTSFAEPWGDGVIFWMLWLTAVFLYGAGFMGARLSPVTLGWQRAFVVYGLVMIVFAGFGFVEWVDGNNEAPLNIAWILGLTAVAGFAAALIGGVRIGCLLGGLALIGAWLGLWAELLDDGLGGDIGTLRGLLMVIALILLVIAMLVALRGRPEGGGTDLVTAAGIAGVFAAGVLTAGMGFGDTFITPVGASAEATADGSAPTSLFWDAVLLLVSLGLVGYAAVTGFRGPGYVGVLGLVFFVYIVGLDLDDSSPAGKVVGWPLVLLLLAGALLIASVLPALRRRTS
jgi:hypothetical protein